ncbi:hypothetical protein P0D73_28695 [Paraburkholderia sp. RL18-101-BIB-B]|uniref:hypothetical protein n=1 Tax=Paraburkholderia sp. RL18-101-BIB-B TaxID=3031634 RepID=UPI0038BB1B69
MQAPFLFKAISADLIAAFAREGEHIGPASVSEIIVTAFGFWTAKLAREYETPFIVVAVPTTHPELPAHLHLRWVIERIKKLLKVDEWKAQKLASITLDLVRKFGLRIDMHSVLFDEHLEHSRTKILKALHDPDFPPAQASVAIGAGVLPWPETSLAARLELIGQDLNFAEVVSRDTTYLWNRPPRDLREVDSVYLDRVDMRDNKPFSAELGLGFSLVKPYAGVGRKPSQNYQLFAPILHYRATPNKWRTSGIVSTTYYETDRVARGGHSLADMIGAPLMSLPRVHVCPACMAVFAPRIAPHRCKESGPHALHLVEILQTRFDTGHTVFTAKEMLADARPPRGRSGDTVTQEALEEFLHAYRGSLALRAFEGTWKLMHKPAIKLKASATPEASAPHAGA